MLRITLGFIGLVQLMLGLVFLFAPSVFISMLGLAVVPAWVSWMFAMFGARALGFAYGMYLAMRQPKQHTGWIATMIGVQAIDWLATLYFLLQGAVTLPQVSTAPFLPIIFIGVLVIYYPRHTSPVLSSAL